MNYGDLVEYYALLEGTSKRLEKTFYVARFLKKVPDADIPHLILLLRGRVFPDWDERKMGIAERLIIKAINVATGHSPKKIEEEWKKIGDLGDVAEKLTIKKSQVTLFQKDISTKNVFDNLQKISTQEGHDTVNRKVQLIAELLTNATPQESKYIIRTCLEDLRVGLGDGSLRDAIAWAYLIDPNYNEVEKEIIPENREAYSAIINEVQEAFNRCNDFSTVAKAAKNGIPALQKITLQIGKPIKVMLAQKVKDIKEGFERVGKPAALEYKYDGFRMIIHKKDNQITIYTRRLEDVTTQFPEVVENIKELVTGSSFILDGEAIGFDFKTGKYLPFQHISQRIRRKYDIKELSEKLPVELNIFDIVHFEGKDYLNSPFMERRKLLEKIVHQKTKQLVLAKQILTESEKEADVFYKESLAKGNEGIMMKNLEGNYKPGSRVGFMIKVKPIMETLDLVIVGAEWGEGKRSGWLTSFTLACIDDNGDFLEIGKVGTGIKELEQEEGVTFEELTNLLKPYMGKEKTREVTVKPKVVLEIAYEEIQKSPTYGSGYALRFPRVLRVREADRDPKDISTLEFVEELYFEQKN